MAQAHICIVVISLSNASCSLADSSQLLRRGPLRHPGELGDEGPGIEAGGGCFVVHNLALPQHGTTDVARAGGR